eukprot:PhM_4_TR19037/c0_g1_i1/m.6583
MSSPNSTPLHKSNNDTVDLIFLENERLKQTIAGLHSKLVHLQGTNMMLEADKADAAERAQDTLAELERLQQVDAQSRRSQSTLPGRRSGRGCRDEDAEFDCGSFGFSLPNDSVIASPTDLLNTTAKSLVDSSTQTNTVPPLAYVLDEGEDTMVASPIPRTSGRRCRASSAVSSLRRADSADTATTSPNLWSHNLSSSGAAGGMPYMPSIGGASVSSSAGFGCSSVPNPAFMITPRSTTTHDDDALGATVSSLLSHRSNCRNTNTNNNDDVLNHSQDDVFDDEAAEDTTAAAPVTSTTPPSTARPRRFGSFARIPSVSAHNSPEEEDITPLPKPPMAPTMTTTSATTVMMREPDIVQEDEANHVESCDGTTQVTPRPRQPPPQPQPVMMTFTRADQTQLRHDYNDARYAMGVYIAREMKMAESRQELDEMVKRRSGGRMSLPRRAVAATLVPSSTSVQSSFAALSNVEMEEVAASACLPPHWRNALSALRRAHDVSVAHASSTCGTSTDPVQHKRTDERKTSSRHHAAPNKREKRQK